ncbi:hypothetical protein B0H16DRAFT_1331116 [Mycena metata]|uniref:Uncharacterized protein n=1 Tax=Mycena metata TaxID=1033252 RepID=A0AAD7MQD0_9AGAR|nr:hypothetical protein B0H16DRAFT_1331116 [Mycena metata]
MLLYIKGALPPQEIRNRLMNPGSEFEQALIKYLEGCHVGEFHGGNINAMQLKKAAKNEQAASGGTEYQNPTLTMPVPPPTLCNKKTCSGCTECSRLSRWWSNFWSTDDLMLKSNVKSKGAKGCLNKEGICMARFPRELFEKSVVDHSDGSLNVKKLEPDINNVTPMLTYCLRCNTDVTSLLSGTAIKVIVAYISDYVSKASLKSYQVFSSMYDVLHENSDPLDAEVKRKDKCRRLLMKIVNSL